MDALPDRWRMKTSDIAAVCLCIALLGVMGFALGISLLLAWMTFHGLDNSPAVDWITLALRVAIMTCLLGLAALLAVIALDKSQ